MRAVSSTDKPPKMDKCQEGGSNTTVQEGWGRSPIPRPSSANMTLLNIEPLSINTHTQGGPALPCSSPMGPRPTPHTPIPPLLPTPHPTLSAPAASSGRPGRKQKERKNERKGERKKNWRPRAIQGKTRASGRKMKGDGRFAFRQMCWVCVTD